MDLFSIYPDNQIWGKLHPTKIDAKHLWKMPGIICSTCGQTWAVIGVSYPLVDLSVLSSDQQYYKPRPVSVDVYEKLRDLIRPFVPKGLPIPPGTDFGMLTGEVEGLSGDFSWVNLWTPLIKRDAYIKLVSLHPDLPEVINAKLINKAYINYDLLEFQIEPHGLLSPASFSSFMPILCPRCGRDDRKVEQIVIDKKSIPSNLDLFRLTEFPTKIIVSRRLRDSILKLGLTNILFSRVKVS